MEQTSNSYRDVSVPIHQALPFLFRPAWFLFLAPMFVHLLLWGVEDSLRDVLRIEVFLALVPVLLIFVFLHEAIHALTWMITGRLSPRDLRFGIDRKTLSPYCHATQAISTRAYRLGAIMPAILTGILPLFYGYTVGDAAISLLAAFMISAAVGDFYVIYLLRDISASARVLDHPQNIGCLVLDSPMQ